VSPQNGTLLHVACARSDGGTNQLSVVELLLAKGISADKQARNGVTPLIMAIESGRIDIAARLLKAGVSVNVTDKDGRTALHYLLQTSSALHRGNVAEAIDLLLRHGANPHLKDNKGISPIDLVQQHARGLTPAARSEVLGKFRDTPVP
jgi:ankyrin repeat protein